MDTSRHNLKTLFEQLGLPSEERQIEQFIKTHKLFSSEVRLETATFWTNAQADFLRDAISSDSDWSEVVDELDARLRH